MRRLMSVRIYFRNDSLIHYGNGERDCQTSWHRTAFCGKHGDTLSKPEGEGSQECLPCIMENEVGGTPEKVKVVTGVQAPVRVPEAVPA